MFPRECLLTDLADFGILVPEQRVGWVERSDTHRVHKNGDGFREGLNPGA
jgi:hypothetical protein